MTSRSSIGNRSHNACGFYYWKNRDLGSIFSHEIRTSEAAGVLFTTTSGNPIPLRTLPHTKKVGIDFPVVVKVIEATALMASITGEI